MLIHMMNSLSSSYFSRYIDNLLVGLKYNSTMLNLCNRNGEKIFITCSGKNDGAGAQAIAIMSTILFARDSGLTYVHTPFNKIAHNTDNDSEWECKWENFFNLGKGEVSIDDVKESGIEVINLSELSKLSLHKSNTLYRVSQCHKYANLFPDRYSNLTDSFKAKYLASDKTHYSLHILPQKINIAVHIRRGDINSSGLNSIRYTDNDFIAKIVRQIVENLSRSGLDVCINLYSQGKIEDFCELQNLNVNFFLDQCVFTTFNSLVNADILVMSKSTLSYTAGLLSDGIKIYEPFYHKPLKDWLSIKKSHVSDENIRSKFLNRWG
jgi:hypothetical protein